MYTYKPSNDTWILVVCILCFLVAGGCFIMAGFANIEKKNIEQRQLDRIERQTK